MLFLYVLNIFFTLDICVRIHYTCKFHCVRSIIRCQNPILNKPAQWNWEVLMHHFERILRYFEEAMHLS